MSSTISFPALSALAVLTPLVPAVFNPAPATIVACAAAAALAAGVVALRHRRWVTRTGAALLTLLAASAALQLMGFGLGDEEIPDDAASALAEEFQAAAHDGALRIMPTPWYANDQLMLAAASLITALLLLVLGRVTHDPGRRAV